MITANTENYLTKNKENRKFKKNNFKVQSNILGPIKTPKYKKPKNKYWKEYSDDTADLE